MTIHQENLMTTNHLGNVPETLRIFLSSLLYQCSPKVEGRFRSLFMMMLLVCFVAVDPLIDLFSVTLPLSLFLLFLLLTVRR